MKHQFLSEMKSLLLNKLKKLTTNERLIYQTLKEHSEPGAFLAGYQPIQSVGLVINSFWDLSEIFTHDARYSPKN
jgi:hypothetical protein